MGCKITRRMFAAHVAAACASTQLGRFASSNHSTKLISGIGIETSTPIVTLKQFYGAGLGLGVKEEDAESITFASRDGWVRFHCVNVAKPTYHFAFNIPENCILPAYEWLRDRVKFIKPPAHLNDRGYPEEVVAFRHWNAHSLFFWDPSGNAVELIARHDLNNGNPKKDFSTAQILEVSEIGLIVDSVTDMAKVAKASLGLNSYVGTSSSFEPVGTPDGLLLFMQRGQKMAFGQGDERAVFRTDVYLARDTVKKVSLDSYPYQFHAHRSP